MRATKHRWRFARDRRAGVGLALGAAVVSGCSVFVNGYAVKHAPNSAAYTTAKNLVAAVLLSLIAAAFMGGGLVKKVHAVSRGQAGALLLIGVLGGGVAFALFFEGLRRTTATDAAFIQKSLLIWVALLAVPLLGERLGPGHLIALALLVAGQLLIVRSSGAVGWQGRGDLMILAATLLWSGEVVMVSYLLRSLPSQLLGAARMGIGCAFLLCFLAASGQLGALRSMGAEGWVWALATGLMLTVYVTAWFAALARAPAVDVTAVLVLGAFITALLDAGVHHVQLAPQAAGLTLVVAGVAVMAMASFRTRARVALPQHA